ncbi:MAG TPA: hypothetical protein DCP90_02285 [Clostridiales bacterium]|nr:MAG: hypothetical protein A2Y22_00340 [Clostridiales bacterium GWD2_32_59]HAN09423.1 hypothetical protein [Clostridiales bacterium]
MIKNKRISIIVFSIILITILVAFNFYEIEKSNVLLTVFNKYSCETVQGNISTVSKLKSSLLTYDDMKKEIEKVLLELDIKNKVQVEKNENDMKLSYVVTRTGDDSETIIKIESKKDENNKIEETYLIINTILYNKIDGLGIVQTLLDKVHKELGLDYNMNITVVGRYEGDMEKNKKIQFADKVFKSIKARKIDSFETDNIYSLYGYTSYIKDFIIQEKNKVNVNLAMRYNSYEDKTYLYIATPIITTEY